MEYNNIFTVDRVIRINKEEVEGLEINNFIKTFLNFDYRLIYKNFLNLKNKIFIEIKIKGIITYLLFNEEVDDYIFDIYITPKIDNIDVNEVSKGAFLVELLAFKLVFIGGNEFNLHGEILVRHNKRAYYL